MDGMPACSYERSWGACLSFCHVGTCRKVPAVYQKVESLPDTTSAATLILGILAFGSEERSQLLMVFLYSSNPQRLAVPGW